MQMEKKAQHGNLTQKADDVQFVSWVGNVTGSHCSCLTAYLPHTQMQTAEEEERGGKKVERHLR